MFKKYLNPWTKVIPPSTTKKAVDKSVSFAMMEKKKPRFIKKAKKQVNYTTIRKQIPSFERSVETQGRCYCFSVH